MKFRGSVGLSLLLALLGGCEGLYSPPLPVHRSPRSSSMRCWMARGRLTPYGSGNAGEGRSRKYESVRKNLGIPKDAIENKSVEQLEKRLAERMKKHVDTNTKRQLQESAKSGEGSAIALSSVELEEVDYYDPDDESFEGGSDAAASGYLSEAEATQLMEEQKEKGATGLFTESVRKKLESRDSFFLRQPTEPTSGDAPQAPTKRSASATRKAAKVELSAKEGPSTKEASGVDRFGDRNDGRSEPAEEEESVDDADERIISLDKLPVLDIYASPSDVALEDDPGITWSAAPQDEAERERGSGKGFEDLGIKAPVVLENLRSRLGVRRPTTVQAKAIPMILEDEDVIIKTHTGSGKTLAFLLPWVERIVAGRQSADAVARKPSKGAGPEVIVICPTRELASQVALVASEVLEGCDAKVLCLPGGANEKRQREKLRREKPAIVVGTPGRLFELTSKGRTGMGAGVLGLRSVRAIILDEADALLDAKGSGFREVRKLLESLFDTAAAVGDDVEDDQSIQVIQASATADKAKVVELFQQMEKEEDTLSTFDPVIVSLGDDAALSQTKGKGRLEQRDSLPTNIAHTYIFADGSNKVYDSVRRFMNTEPPPGCVLIYVEGPEEVKRLSDYLLRNSILAAPLSGRESKEDRVDVLNSLRDGRLGVVVTTDVASRGLDFPGVSHVVNMGVPKSVKVYIHRAGRCARRGEPGIVVSIIPQRNADAGKSDSSRWGLGLLKKYEEAIGMELIEARLRFGRLLRND
uniref:RNA helicase n=1 Tax=Pinguiococcus pyrenoidosus TaxID=172671 RepID=A0A7R9YFG2_9STRA|mmetsp:Transcript_7233/g.27614  ORF Transcript_7233/g.27614 Transcript_7233/m.27614 type:complete len:754 (+) Transcript_7233:296-2557(+)